MSIKIIIEPSVYVLGRQTVDDTELNRFLTDHGIAWESDSEVASEVLTETAGRVCYMSFAKPRPGGNAAYLTHIKEVGHGSVLEHAVWNLLLTGVSRSLTHELVRHRAGFGFSQLSQRYVDESVAEYVCPVAYQEAVAAYRHFHSHEYGDAQPFDHFAGGKYAADYQRYYALVDLGSTWVNAAEHLHERYEMLVHKASKLWPDAERKEIRQAARSVLPNATETKVFVTANARALRHFLEQRGSRHAEPEIRKLATAILDVVQKDAPNLFSDYERTPLPDGTFELTTAFKKV